MDVRMPDGTVITNVPEGTTKAQLLSSLEQLRGGQDVGNGIDSGGAPVSAPQAPGIPGGQVGRPDVLGAAPVGAQAQAVIEPALTMLTGAIAEPIAGVAGVVQALSPFAEPGAGARAVEATREALTFQPRTQVGRAGLEAVGEALQPVGEALKAAETFLGDETFQSTKSPALAAAATTIPTALLEVLGFAAGKGLIKGAKKIRQTSKKKEIKKALVEAAPEIDQLKDVARQVYKELDDSGVRLRTESMNSLVGSIESTLKKAGLDPDITPKAFQALNRIKSEAGTSPSLTQIDTLRKVAQGAASTLDPADARMGSMIIDQIDSFLDAADPSVFKKGAVKASEVAPKYKAARGLWGRARRSELINEAFEKARNQASGFENGIVTQFRSILNNKKKARFFKPNEIKAMQDVVRGTTPTNIAKLIGRFGFSEGHATNIIGGALGATAGGLAFGTPGAIAVPIIGQVSRKLAQRLTRRGAEFADAVVRAGDDAERIATLYLKNTPKAQRSAAELSELLMKTDIEKALLSKNNLLTQAAEISKGRKIINAIGATTALGAPGAIKQLEEE